MLKAFANCASARSWVQQCRKREAHIGDGVSCPKNKRPQRQSTLDAKCLARTAAPMADDAIYPRQGEERRVGSPRVSTKPSFGVDNDRAGAGKGRLNLYRETKFSGLTGKTMFSLHHE